MSHIGPWSQALVRWVETQLNLHDHSPLLLFLGGSQGVGKTTAMEAVKDAFPGSVLPLSLDDFYLTAQQRNVLANAVHPLCNTRGPPGTHDLDLLHEILDQCLDRKSTLDIRWPAFDKARDDRLPADQWRRHTGLPRVILLEGWMMGCTPDAQAAFEEPINALEREGDADGRWRAYQENLLATQYSRLWERADGFFYALPAEFGFVSEWRAQQEAGNRGEEATATNDELRNWVDNFVMYYERLTRRMIGGGHIAGTRLLLERNRSVKDSAGRAHKPGR